MQYIDLHTHLPAGAPDILEIENRYFGQPGAEHAPLFSAGLHPWYLQDVDWAAATAWLRAQAADTACLAIGEAGLDKLTPTPWDRQLAAFSICLKVAAETGKPLVIHCVRAYGEVLQLLRRPPVHRALKTVFHGFDKHPRTAHLLLEAGCYLSFGAALFREKSHAAEALRETPANRFFLETDDENLDIRAVYERAAEISGWPVEHLQFQLWDNFTHFFGPGAAPVMPGIR